MPPSQAAFGVEYRFFAGSPCHIRAVLAPSTAAFLILWESRLATALSAQYS
jgi:hypothetical protein